jgi:hypothetical protein
VRAQIVSQLSWIGRFRQAVLSAQEEIVIARHAEYLAR